MKSYVNNNVNMHLDFHGSDETPLSPNVLDPLQQLRKHTYYITYIPNFMRIAYVS